MQLIFIGCGDAFGSGGRFNTCFLIDAAETRFLIDCGASSLVALKRANIDPDSIDLVILSHLHGDHFGGLVFLLREATLFKTRHRPLTIAGPPGTQQRLREAIEVFFPGGSAPPERFALDIVELEPERPRTLGAIQACGYVVDHPSGAPTLALRVEADGKTIGYSADTRWVDGLINVAKDTDLFICEAYFFDRTVGRHLDYMTVRSRLDQLNARRIILTHMHLDMLNRLEEVDLETAEDGKVVVL